MTQSNNSIARKKIIVMIAAVVGLLLFMYALTVILPLIFNPKGDGSQQDEIIADYDFFEADYNEDIFKNEEYMNKIKDGIFYYDDGSVIGLIDEKSAASYGEATKLVVDMLYDVINGRYDDYNEYFSERYFDTHEPKKSFTMQKLYNGKITFLSEETLTEGKETYTKYFYKVKYNIYQNNGTYRKDIGDGYKEQYITITDREGSLKIDSMETARYK